MADNNHAGKMKNAAGLLTGLANISNFGLSLISPVLILLVLSLWIEKRFGVGDWLTAAAIICGLISGGCNFYNYAKSEIRKADREAQKAQKAIDSSRYAQKKGGKDSSEDDKAGRIG